MKNKMLIIQPSDKRAGPVLGSLALARLMKEELRTDVHWISLNTPQDLKKEIESTAKYTSLCQLNFFQKYFFIKKYIKGNDIKVIYSSSFRPDLINFLLSNFNKIKRVSGPRGDLYKNYKYDYGVIFGSILAFIQYLIMNFLDKRIALSSYMQNFKPFPLWKDLDLIPNFIDEETVKVLSNRESNNKNEYDIIFLGQLSERKRPQMVLEVVKKFFEAGNALKAIFIGEGPLNDKLQEQAKAWKIDHLITFLGFVENPYPYLKNSKVLFLPSLSEGVSRAAMESLYLGTPVILADVEAGKELIVPGINGELIARDSTEEIAKKILSCIKIKSSIKESLLPNKFTKKAVSTSYGKLFNFQLLNE